MKEISVIDPQLISARIPQAFLGNPFSVMHHRSYGNIDYEIGQPHCVAKIRGGKNWTAFVHTHKEKVTTHGLVPEVEGFEIIDSAELDHVKALEKAQQIFSSQTR